MKFFVNITEHTIAFGKEGLGCFEGLQGVEVELGGLGKNLNCILELAHPAVT